MTSVTEMADDPGASGRLLFVLALFAGLLLRLVKLGSPDLFGPDEGAWAVGARNLVEGGLPQLLSLSATPLGDASGMPVFFPAILAVMVKTFGAYEWAIRLPSVFAGLVAAFVLERIVRRGYGQPAGHIAGAFAALALPLVLSSRAATVEPMLTLLGLGGIIFGLRAFEEDSPGEAPLAGLLFGLGFLTKGYAVGLFVLPLLVALLFRPRLFALGRTKRTLALLAGTFLLTAGLPFLLVSLLRPEALGAYLARAFGSAPEALRQLTDVTLVSADLRLIVKTLFVLLPLVGVGIAYLTRPLGEEEIVSGATGGDRRLSHMALWCAYGVELVVLVAVAGSLELSSTPVLPALSALAGLGGAALLTHPRSVIRARFEMAATIASGTVRSPARGASRRHVERAVLQRRVGGALHGCRRLRGDRPLHRRRRLARLGGCLPPLRAARRARLPLHPPRLGGARGRAVDPSRPPRPPDGVPGARRTGRARAPSAPAARRHVPGARARRPRLPPLPHRDHLGRSSFRRADRRGGPPRHDGRLGLPGEVDRRGRRSGAARPRLAHREHARGDRRGRRARGQADRPPRLRRAPSLIIDGP
ncbi:MAG: glycosyltransferase family 39 protein [Holophagales bacterium]|nr:glycosyltransferase family 39 protein [Holophagales bacterium]